LRRRGSGLLLLQQHIGKQQHEQQMRRKGQCQCKAPTEQLWKAPEQPKPKGRPLR
jgi:hypothetical protein